MTPWLTLAQAAPLEESQTLLYLIYIIVFVAAFVLALTGFLVMSEGWESYEEKFLEGAERSIEDLFLTIPAKQLLWLRFLAALVLSVLFLLLFKDWLPVVVGAGIGFLLPQLALNFHKRARQKQFNEQLVGALNTITNALRTGFSLPKAFQLIATDMPKPICQEFGILVQTLRLGSELDEGLEDMLERMPSDDLDLVITSVLISNEVGGNLAEVFDRIAYTIRERRRLEGRIDALTSQGKAQGCIVSVLPIAMAFVINQIDPNLIKPFFEDWRGQIALAIMIVMEIAGYLLIKKITTIEV